MKHRILQTKLLIVLFLSPVAIFFFSPSAVGQKIIPLYAGDPPNALAVTRDEYVDPGSKQLMGVTNPTLTAYLPSADNNSGTAVIICPGGGYGSLVMDREGSDVAKIFVSKGIAAFVLKYRLPDSNAMKNMSICPLQDAQAAIKMLRQQSATFNIDAHKIGMMGFSAGGHLAATAGNRFNESVIGNEDRINLRPDFLILIYPIISMLNEIGHQGSTDNLLGHHPPDSLVKYFSNELQVTKNTPPAFIAYADNDQSVMNGILFYKALHAKKVSAELHVYAKGGHGFLKDLPNEEWLGRCTHWLEYCGWYKKPVIRR